LITTASSDARSAGVLWLLEISLVVLLVSSAPAQGRVDHIFIVVNENRSFDTFFATFQNEVSSLPAYGAKAVGQCSTSSPSNILRGCYTETDCGGKIGTTAYCHRGSALEGLFTAQRHTGAYVAVTHNLANGQDYNCGHAWAAGMFDINGGAMNGFDQSKTCGGPTYSTSPLTYYNHSDFCGYAGGTLSGGLCSMPTLWNYAEQGTLMDHFYASLIGPSYPNHLYLISAQANEAVENPDDAVINNWNCDSPVIINGSIKNPTPPYSPPYTYPGSLGSVSVTTGLYYRGGQCSNGASCRCNAEAGIHTVPTNAICSDAADCGSANPTCTIALDSTASGCVGGTKGCLCPNVTTIADQMDAAGVTWHYYTPIGNGADGYSWNPVSYVQHLRFGPDWTKDVSYPGDKPGDTADITSFQTAVTKCTTAPTCTSLAQVVWISTGEPQNGHPVVPGTNVVQSNQAWTVSVVQAITQNPTVYDHSIIFIVYDDWGGFYDHITPPSITNTSWGVRVGAICVGPFCQNGISHQAYEFSSILRCIESPPGGVWSVSNLGQQDTNPNVVNICSAPGTVTNGEWSSGGVINLAGGGGRIDRKP